MNENSMFSTQSTVRVYLHHIFCTFTAQKYAAGVTFKAQFSPSKQVLFFASVTYETKSGMEIITQCKLYQSSKPSKLLKKG